MKDNVQALKYSKRDNIVRIYRILLARPL